MKLLRIFVPCGSDACQLQLPRVDLDRTRLNTQPQKKDTQVFMPTNYVSLRDVLEDCVRIGLSLTRARISVLQYPNGKSYRLDFAFEQGDSIPDEDVLVVDGFFRDTVFGLQGGWRDKYGNYSLRCFVSEGGSAVLLRKVVIIDGKLSLIEG